MARFGIGVANATTAAAAVGVTAPGRDPGPATYGQAGHEENGPDDHRKPRQEPSHAFRRELSGRQSGLLTLWQNASRSAANV